MRASGSGTPKLCAVASPKLSASSTRAKTQAKAKHRASTVAIVAQALQLTNAVEPSMKPCMACSTCGCSSEINDVTAPSTTPTTTPANNRRSVCCTPRASSSVSTTASTAPTKAAPVRPKPSQAVMAQALPPHKLKYTPTPSDAPEALPSKYGSASGLRNRPCATAPARPSKAPPSHAPKLRGKRMSHTIWRDTASAPADHQACQP